MLVPWPWKREGGHSPRTPRHPLPVEDLALKRGKGRQFFNLQFPRKEPRALIFAAQERGGEGSFRGRKEMATAIKGTWKSRESKRWPFTDSEGPLREDQEQKDAGHCEGLALTLKKIR